MSKLRVNMLNLPFSSVTKQFFLSSQTATSLDQFANRITKLISREALSPLVDLIKRAALLFFAGKYGCRPSEYGLVQDSLESGVFS